MLQRFTLVALGIMKSFFFVAIAAAGPIGTAFTYQGVLQENGVPASGSFDLRFELYDGQDAQTATQFGDTLVRCAIEVSEGVFTVELDFGAVFDGEALYLAVSVAPAGSCDVATVWTELTPAQPLTAAPYALYALSGNSGPPGPPGPPGATAWTEGEGDLSYRDGNVSVGTEESMASLTVQGYFTRQITGLVTVGTGQLTVTGTGTLFSSELEPQDALIIGEEASVVASIEGETSLTLAAPRATGALDSTAFTGGDLLRINDAAGQLRVRVEENGDLLVAGRIGAAELCDENGENCSAVLDLATRSCPQGYVAVNAEYCIEVADRSFDRWTAALETCRAGGGHLCSPAEWTTACENRVALGLVRMLDSVEWTSSNTSSGVVAVSVSGNCPQVGVQNYNLNHDFRCCRYR